MEPALTAAGARQISKVVVVGGGTAGWLAACRIAAAADPAAPHPLSVMLVESPEVATIGVGEGTWPTMRATLDRIGIREAEFLQACDGAFKQGSRFDGWRTGEADDWYLHPFTAPVEGDPHRLVDGWRDRATGRFADLVSPQARVCAQALAPRQRAMPEYAGALNYAYHFDAGKFAALLARHGVERLGVRHVRDHVVGVDRMADGDIAALRLRDSGTVDGDLFIDCSGHAALLIGGQFDVPLVDRGDVLFNDRALAVQVPVAADSPIASQTNATAHAAGWIWDIGLPTRRGVGCVYSSRYLSDDAAVATLQAHVARIAPDVSWTSLSPRLLSFRSGHRERFWVRNCLAVGLSAGFLEPLEASAIVLIELSLDALLESFPTTRAAMDGHAAQFDALFRYRWDRIVEFLKLHYILSERDEAYWRDHRDPASVPSRLTELMALWRDHPPSRRDFPQIDEVFPAASYQYVLYGMGFAPPAANPIRSNRPPPAFGQIEQRARTLTASLPANRAYLDALAASSPAVMSRAS